MNKRPHKCLSFIRHAYEGFSFNSLLELIWQTTRPIKLRNITEFIGNNKTPIHVCICLLHKQKYDDLVY
uniref:Uncharacterized protein n=1 Tax=Rhizophora mucronata TaxID=61149 RepID=A0A2P2PQX7_RHIMU